MLRRLQSVIYDPEGLLRRSVQAPPNRGKTAGKWSHTTGHEGRDIPQVCKELPSQNGTLLALGTA